MGKDIYQEIIDHFSAEGTGPLAISRTYDLTHEESYVIMEDESKQAHNAVKDLGLSYTIDAKHKARTEGDQELENIVTITWDFWV